MGAILPRDVRTPVRASHPDEADLPEAERTIWPLYPLPAQARREISDQSFSIEETALKPFVIPRNGTREYLSVLYALGKPEGGPFEREWEGKTIPALGREVPTDAFLSTLPDNLWAWIVERIENENRLTEEDAGKSKPQSKSPSGTSETPGPTADVADSPTTS